MTRRFTVQLGRTGPWYVASMEGVVGGWEFRQPEQVKTKVPEGLALLYHMETKDVQVDWRYDEPLSAATFSEAA